jgi:hypothetical protein
VKERFSRKEKAAVALTLIAEEHLKSYPAEEQERTVRRFGLKVAKLSKEERQSSKSRAIS